MKVLHLAASFERNGGGAAIAAQRLHNALVSGGLQSACLSFSPEKTNQGYHAYKHESRTVGRFINRLRYERLKFTRNILVNRGKRPSALFTDHKTHFYATLNNQIPSADLMHLHWISGFIDLESFVGKYAGKIPIVWSIHDMNPITGGCHVNYSCSRFEIGCGECPVLSSNKKRDYSSIVWRQKKKIFDNLSKNDLLIVCPSHWVSQMVSKSPLLNKFSTTVVPLCVDTQVYRPATHNLRARLGLPEDKLIAGFVSTNLQREGKGFDVLCASLKHMGRLSDFHFLFVGAKSGKVKFEGEYTHIESIGDDSALAAIYGVMDFLVAPSRQETFGQTVLEAMACGVPVIGSSIGGFLDQIVPGENGWLFPSGDEKSLAQLMDSITLNRETIVDFRAKARQQVLEKNCLTAVAEKIQDVYKLAIDNI